MAAYTRLIGFLSFLSLAISGYAAPFELLETRATTSATVQFTVNLTWENYAPVGAAPRKAILVNGTIPGPALRCNIGDTVEFLVHNNLPNVTAVHFHGITQLNTPWSDGVPGLSQAPIQPGKSFLYTWTADESGTYFYHSHYKGQIMDGLYGAIIVAPASDAVKPWSLISNDTTQQTAMNLAEKALQPVFLSDWSKYNSHEFYAFEQAANIDNACADSILVNGQGSVYCLSRDELTAYTSPKLPPLLAAVNPPQLTDKGCLPPNLPATQGNFTFNISAVPQDLYYTCTPSTGNTTSITVDPAQGWAALTFINTGGFSILKFTIDSHKMWVYAVDGQYVVPQLVDQITVSNGNRYQVLIRLDQNPAQYSIRVANSGLNQVISGFAVLNYKGSVGPASSDPNALSGMNYAGVNLTQLVPFNDRKAVPYPALSVGTKADTTFIFNIQKPGRPLGAYQWTLTGTDGLNLTQEDVPTPLLFQQPSAVPASDLILRTKKGQWVDLIIKVTGPLAQPHPIHKHSNKAYVLGQGIGPFNFSTVADAAAVMPNTTFNFANPAYRDTFTTTPAEGNSSWMAVRYHVENPGAFLLHCHVQTHLSGGMAAVLLDGTDAWPTVPKQYLNGTGITLQLKPEAKIAPEN